MAHDVKTLERALAIAAEIITDARFDECPPYVQDNRWDHPGKGGCEQQCGKDKNIHEQSAECWRLYFLSKAEEN